VLVSYKTLQAWAETVAIREVQVKTKKGYKKKMIRIKIDMRVTPTGRHFYSEKSIARLAYQLGLAKTPEELMYFTNTSKKGS
jgi:hypothetical protein